MLFLPRGLVWLLSGLCFLVAVGAARGEAVLTLRPVAVVAGPTVRVADVANLEGADAAALGPVVVVTAAGGSVSITLDAVRAALGESGANLGRLRLRGVAACAVEVRAVPAPTEVPNQPALVEANAYAPAILVTPAPPTADPLGDRLRHRLAGWLGLDPDDHDALHLTTSPDDAVLLARPATEARFRVEPLGRPRLGRVSVRIEERDPDGTLTLHTVSVETEREVLAAVATGPIRRGDTFSAANVALERVTIGREPAGAEAPLATLAGVLGAEAETSLRPGTRLVPGHLARLALVERGGHVTVRVAAGAVELVAEGFAEGDAALGEAVTIRLGKARGQRARTVEAVVTGSNEVRVDQL